MSVVAVAHGVTSEALVAVVGGVDPAEALPFDTEWGAVVVAGTPTARVGDWLVAGTPTRDPWGVPGADAVEAVAVAAAFDRYGPAAVQLAGGPFVAVDLGYGRVVRAMNGIVPLHVSGRGTWVASTSAEVVEALAEGGRAEPVEPGTSMSPVRDVARWGPIAPDPAGGDVPWAWVDTSVAERVAVAGLGALSRLAGAPDVWCAADGLALYLPRLARLRRAADPLARYAELRAELPRRWWTARRAGRWLFAPAFERPVLDTIAMLR